MTRAPRRTIFTLGCLVLVLAAASPASPATLMMPNRDALKGTQLVVWGVNDSFPNNGTSSIPTTYTLDFGDGNSTSGNVTDRSYIAVTKTYNAAGIFTVTMSVTRSGVTETGTTTVQVFDPAALSAEDLRGIGINLAIQNGLRYLWTAQSNRAANFKNTDPPSSTTLWTGTNSNMAWTSMVVLAFENHGYQVPDHPTNAPTGLYETYVVQRGLNFIFNSALKQTLSVEPAGNPCQVVGFDPPPAPASTCTGLRADGSAGYSTAVATLAVAGSGAPTRVVQPTGPTSNANFVHGKTYAEILQRLANTVVWGQADTGDRGGWDYGLDTTRSDGSTMGWDVLALLDAAAAGATVPAFAKTELAIALSLGLNNDGSLDYDANANAASSVYPNVARTGIGLQALFLTGAQLGVDARVQKAIDFINARWSGAALAGDYTATCGSTRMNKGCLYAMFNVFKALKLYGKNTLPGVTRPAGPGSIPAGDWHADYQDHLVANQSSPTLTTGGQWGGPVYGFSCCASVVSGITALAELILAPTALVLPTTLSLAPATATNDVTQGDVTHTVTATAATAGGGVVPGATVTFTIISGPNAGASGTCNGIPTTNTCSTDVNGTAAFTYTCNATCMAQGGPDQIRATLGSLTAGPVEKIWVSNQKPTAQCQDVPVRTSETPVNACQTQASIDNGSFDPDGDQITLSQTPAGPYGLGPTDVTLTVDDGSLSSQCTAQVTLVDDTKPSVTCTGNQTLQADADCKATLALSPTASDNCTASLTPTCDPASLTLSAPGSATANCSVADGSGNTSTCSTTLTMVDVTPPIVTCPAGQEVVADASCKGTATVTATAADNCNAGPVSCGPGGPYNLGSNSVSCSATDGSGNPGVCGTTVTVVDKTPPALICSPNQTVECTSPAGASTTVSATAADNCSVGPASCSPGSGTFSLGATTVTCGASDGSGNLGSCTSTVTVADTTPPVVSCNNPPTITPNQAPISFTATATDICSAVTVQVASYTCTMVNGAGKTVDKTGSCVVQMSGATVTIADSGGVGDHITWTVVATDAQNNSSTVTCAVDVVNPGQGVAGGGGKGNNGVGNGVDPQPPGNPPINDAPGTSPGNPGNRKK